MEMTSLEGALGALEREAEASTKLLAGALREAKRIKAAAAAGQLRDVQAALDNAARLSAAASDATADLRAGWQFDTDAYLSEGHYTKEVLALAAEEGLSAFESDGRILSYPAIVQVSPNDATVLIDRRRERRIRPSVLVKSLKLLQSRPPKFRAESFLEALCSAYRAVVGMQGQRSGATVKLVDVYTLLTILPGTSKDYTKAEFARDLYLLDQSGIITARNGATLRLPASALTRGGGVFVTVARNGQEKVYAGLCFEGDNDSDQ